MTELKWQDDTGYTYLKPKAEQPVRVVSIETNGTRLIVHRLHGCDGWFMSLRDEGRTLVSDHLLTEGDDLDEAKCMALAFGIDLLAERVTQYQDVIDKLGGMH